MTDVPIASDRPVLCQGKDDETAPARRASADPAHFAELYRRHEGRIFRYLLLRVRDIALARDLTSQTFLAAMEGIASYRGQGAFAAWLFGIARRQLALHFRGERPSLSLDALENLASSAPLPEEVVEGKLRLEAVAQALEHIAPDRAEALALRIFGGLSAAEVGEVLGKSEAAVKMLVHRGVCDLQVRFRSEEGSDV